MKNRRWVVIAGLAGACSVVLVTAVVHAAGEKGHSPIMEAKLKQSQALLEGLANQDFTLLKENAKKLKAITGFEQWVHYEDKNYQLQLGLFRSANEELIRQADAKNIDGSTLAFMQLTMSCVNCHKQMRELK